jgi:hypothetical protein
VGSCQLNIRTYLDSYHKSKAKAFCQVCRLSERYYLKFELFVGKSRFSLERYSKYTRAKQELNHQRTTHSNTPEQQEHSQLPGHQAEESISILEVTLKELVNAENEQSKFMAADKRIIQDRKLIVRNHNSVRKKVNKLVNENEYMRSSKSVDKTNLNTLLHWKEVNKSQMRSSISR